VACSAARDGHIDVVKSVALGFGKRPDSFCCAFQKLEPVRWYALATRTHGITVEHKRRPRCQVAETLAKGAQGTLSLGTDHLHDLRRSGHGLCIHRLAFDPFDLFGL
jgi:hypothetical protein